jgi:hypothetical protein
MSTKRRDPDRMSTNEVIALGQSTALGLAMVLEGPALTVAAPGAPIVIGYAFALSVVLFATARATAKTGLALALAGATTGLAIVVPHVLRNGLSLTGLEALLTLASALMTTGRCGTGWARGRARSLVDRNPTTFETSVLA